MWVCCEEFCNDALRTLYIYSLTSTYMYGFIFLRTGLVTVDGPWYRLVSCVDDSSRPTHQTYNTSRATATTARFS